MLSKLKSVIPAEAGIQCFNYLDTGLRRCDEINQCFLSGADFKRSDIASDNTCPQCHSEAHASRRTDLVGPLAERIAPPRQRLAASGSDGPGLLRP